MNNSQNLERCVEQNERARLEVLEYNLKSNNDIRSL